MASLSCILARKILWTEELGRLQPMGVERVGHDLVTKPPPPNLIPFFEFEELIWQYFEQYLAK